MSSQNRSGSHYENHQRAAELHDLAAHAHRSADQHHNRQDHWSGKEMSRLALEHSNKAYLHTQEIHRAQAAADRIAIAELAHQIWLSKGSPEGTADADWREAEQQYAKQHTTKG